MNKTKRRRWSFENCQQEALKFKTKSEWSKNSPSSYIVAHRNGWLSDCGAHMTILWESKWNKESCLYVANLCKTKTEFITKYCGAYAAAKRYGWMNECVSHMEIIGSRFKRVIYAFEFPDKSVYIGLTFNPDQRKNEHLNPKRIKKSSVYKHILKTNQQPKFKILTPYLPIEQAQISEEEFLQKYRNSEWKILNKNKTGALGTVKQIFTKEVCFENAGQYLTYRDWMRGSRSAYVISSKNGWLNEIKNTIFNIS